MTQCAVGYVTRQCTLDPGYSPVFQAVADPGDGDASPPAWELLKEQRRVVVGLMRPIVTSSLMRIDEQ